MQRVLFACPSSQYQPAIVAVCRNSVPIGVWPRGWLSVGEWEISMNILIGIVLGSILAGLMTGQDILSDAWSKLSRSHIKDQRRNVVIEKYTSEVLKNLETLNKRAESERKRDECLADADRVRRANPLDGSLTSPGRFCQ